MICMGMSDEGSGLNLVLTYDTPQHPIEIGTVQAVEIETATPVKEIEMSVMKVNMITNEQTQIKVEV